MLRRVVFVFLIVTMHSYLFACGGSCLECHPSLKPYINDKDHIILNECTNCHNTPSQQGQCGQDCFDCHSKDKIYAQKDVVAHQALKACNACHKEKEDFMLVKRSMTPNQETLIHFLK